MENQPKRIIAIVGMAGSGKSEVVDYLQNKYRWPNIYFGDVIFEEMKNEGLEENQNNERITREKLRVEEGMGVCASRSLEKIKQAQEGSNVVLIESLYSWDEYKILKREFGDILKVVAIYSSPALRFSRLQNRPIRPLRTFEEFEKRDWTEIENTAKGGPIAVADYTVVNASTLEELRRQVDQVIEREGVGNNIGVKI
ncbi:AAA family ATPase [bacterium]|jgi:dephospho-CoA kinase|nr:AAA family ATPase [bacterium]MBT4251025.1 AAA family ATPase [bacterium]MBT4597743.1 AAA family ATPase [bacterium]MBT6753838.1 AAA family ATPase [bacterium]MBT7037450.1 AAA family ATPase [bacterium]